MRTFTIGKNDATKRLDKFIDKAAPMLPKNLMYKYIRNKRIKVNGKRGEISYKLRESDVVSLYINDEFFGSKEPKYDFLSAGKSKTLDGFLIGGRNIGAWVTAFAYGTTYFSAVVFVGYAGQHGWNIGIGCIWIGIG